MNSLTTHTLLAQYSKNTDCDYENKIWIDILHIKNLCKYTSYVNKYH